MYLLGYDIGTSSVKASLVDATTGRALASDFFPKQEAAIKALHPGWAEQDPELVAVSQGGYSFCCGKSPY